MNRVEKIVEKGIDFILFIIMACMVFMVLSNAVLRYFFHSGWVESEELARYAFVWVSFLGAAIAYKENTHVGVNLITGRFHGKKKVVSNIVIEIFILISMAIVFYGGFLYNSVSGATPSSATRWPLSVMIVSILAGSLLIFLMSLKKTVGLFRHLISGDNIDEEGGR